ncbi:MAG: L-rhamnose/proton symporter RhaT [Planctomycetia bacterium]|nr:L-rhamnose/proton symporter RhaT [Planctomycetia bacterium]
MGPILGVILLWLGGLSSASFYAPVHRIRNWAWATYWISLGFVAWLIMPMLGALLVSTDLFGILRTSPGVSLFQSYFFGVLWGFGGLMAALALRYLGLGLGNSIALGVCAIVGTVVPAVVEHKAGLLIATRGGQTILVGLVVCLLGIVLCGYAGVLKERSGAGVSNGSTPAGEFRFARGLFMAIFGGIASSFMAFSLISGAPIAQAAVDAGTPDVFKNIPVLVLSLAGGFTTNFIYALIVTMRNHTLGDYCLPDRKILLANFFWSAVSGVMWYAQYFFYGMGTTRMGQYDFASWSIFMSSIVLCANLWGLALKEWTQTDRKTKWVLWSGIAVLVLSICLIGLGNWIDQGA